MKVILLKEINNLGKLGDIIEVKNGYARNFLIPKGFVKFINISILLKTKIKKLKIKQKKMEKIFNTKILANKINNLNIKIYKKSFEDGKLFSDITVDDILLILKKNFIEINKINLFFEPIKTIGKYKIFINLLYNNMYTNLLISVLKKKN